MSCITENTVVIKRTDCVKFRKRIKEQGDNDRISNVVKVFANSKYAIYVFDANGMPICLEDTISNPHDITFYIKETCYRRGEIDTEKLCDKGYLKDSRIHCARLLKDMLSPKSYDKVAKLIKYTF